jgi:hypothetical protein
VTSLIKRLASSEGIAYSVALGVISIGIIVVCFQLRPGPVVNAETYSRISNGMSKPDVETVLGRGELSSLAKQWWPEETGVAFIHKGKSACIIVWYDENETVRAKELLRALNRPKSWLTKVLELF